MKPALTLLTKTMTPDVHNPTIASTIAVAPSLVQLDAEEQPPSPPDSHNTSSNSTAPSDQDYFRVTINLPELCLAASKLRNGVHCSLGEYLTGGYNMLQEINFDDEEKWLARLPLPYASLECDALLESYVATLNYLRLNSTLPVPRVYDCKLKDDKENTVGVSYMFMEHLPGHVIRLDDIDEKDEKAWNIAKNMSEKLHRQISKYILQLSTLRFDVIGTLRETPLFSGNFTIGPFIDEGVTDPEERALMWKRSPTQGPFRSTDEYYTALNRLNMDYELEHGGEDDHLYYTEMCLMEQLQPALSMPQYNDGPFVLYHDDLSSNNILVDDDYNITAIIDFPGTIMPLPSLFVAPRLVHHRDSRTPMTDRKKFREIFLDEASNCMKIDVDVGELMQTADSRRKFDLALRHTWASRYVAGLVKEVLGIDFDEYYSEKKRVLSEIQAERMAQWKKDNEKGRLKKLKKKVAGVVRTVREWVKKSFKFERASGN